MSNYEIVHYSRSKIEKAGKTIAKYDGISSEFGKYIPVIDNWRAAHAYPLDQITRLLSKTLDGRDMTYVVQRLKRVDSIIRKLQRRNNTGLLRMQDLGGCRIVVPDISHIYHTVDTVKICLDREGHKIVREYDYINKPKSESGYRSYHIVAQYRSTENKSYDGMFIEVQIRSKLEHSWATAVEVLDTVLMETLKEGTGDKDYMYFFKLISALFSIEEESPLVLGVPTNKKEIVSEIYRIDNLKNIREKLSAYNSAIKFSGNYPEKSDYYLLIVDMRTCTISTRAFMKEDIAKAVGEYQAIEQTKQQKGIDVVLVAAKSFDIIREGYPNYFSETLFFLYKISSLCAEYPEKPSVSIDFTANGMKVADEFTATPITRNVPDNVSKFTNSLNGIGIIEGNIYYCPAWAISLDNSYLRFSGIKMNRKAFVGDNVDFEVRTVQGPAIIALSSGACFFIEDEEWSYVCETNSIIIRSKSDTNKRMLKVLLAWAKSNLCSWDLLWNRHENSIYHKSVFLEFYMPALDANSMDKTCRIVDKILEKEKRFVEEFNKKYDRNDAKSTEFVDNFNIDILDSLREIEEIFCNHYGIEKEEQQIISNELQLKGYYSYS